VVIHTHLGQGFQGLGDLGEHRHDLVRGCACQGSKTHALDQIHHQVCRTVLHHPGVQEGREALEAQGLDRSRRMEESIPPDRIPGRRRGADHLDGNRSPGGGIQRPMHRRSSTGMEKHLQPETFPEVHLVSNHIFLPPNRSSAAGPPGAPVVNRNAAGRSRRFVGQLGRHESHMLHIRFPGLW